MAYYAGVDLGATNLRAAVADEEGTILGIERRPTPRGPTGIAVTEAVLDALRTAAATAGVDPTDVRAVGVGSIGPLDLAEGAVDSPANLPDTIDWIPLVGPIRELVDSREVYLHNDTAAGVIGERFHSDRNPDDMVYLTISSGIGAGVTVDGNVLAGWDGNAGEVGHYVVDPQGRRTCGCGREGHWEAYCSGDNIPGYARLLAEDHDGDTALPVDDPDFSAADVFEHAEDDDLAGHVVDQLAYWNAMGVTNLVQSFAPLVVYVGGAVALNNPERVVDPIREQLDEIVFNNVPDVQLTELGDDVVIEGAIASALTGGTGDRAKL
ncbi:ROK family protein [Halospeciosus flavus]|uniref:ROK family protein n=1 Tax=Halospeciosus flavus TaxID=3032283 RepID=A0ABD5Z5R8_9EURY|nr:ROK family protein [Halospeciosus flavus]